MNPAISKDNGEALATVTVSSRIPEFWADQTRLWFVQFEAVVENQKLTDAAKMNLVVTKLGKSAIQQVSDILLAPAEARKYQTLKDRLLEVFEESETRKLQKLISEMELGDQRPSQLLRRMRDLAREKVTEETLRLLWQSHLPAAVRAIFTVTDSKSLDVLAAIADKVLESTAGGAAQLSEVRETGSSNQRDTEASGTNQIIGELAKINLRLRELERGRPRHVKPVPTGRSKSGTSRRHNSSWLCFYHFRYKERANKCVKPCNWKGAQPRSMGN